MPRFWKVTLQGKGVIRRGLETEAEAREIAERWQGSHAEHRGLLGQKDRGDYVEVKRDHDAEKEWDQRYDEMKRGNPQKIPFILGST